MRLVNAAPPQHVWGQPEQSSPEIAARLEALNVAAEKANAVQAALWEAETAQCNANLAALVSVLRGMCPSVEKVDLRVDEEGFDDGTFDRTTAKVTCGCEGGSVMEVSTQHDSEFEEFHSTQDPFLASSRCRIDIETMDHHTLERADVSDMTRERDLDFGWEFEIDIMGDHLEALGVARDNKQAYDLLREQGRWWELAEGDRSVELALAMYENP